MHSNDWHYPTSIRAGAGRVRELADACRVTGIKRPLLITDRFLGGTDMIASAVKDCRRQLGHCGLFDRVKGNPTGTNVAEGWRFIAPVVTTASSHSAAARRWMPPRPWH